VRARIDLHSHPLNFGVLVKQSLVFIALLAIVGCIPAPRMTDEQLHARAYDLAQKFIIVDTHLDVPERLAEKWENITDSTGGDFDVPRARRGGLNAPFMAIYTSADEEVKGLSQQKADTEIAIVESFLKRRPEIFAPAFSPADILKNTSAGKISLPMGMENGGPLEGKLENVAYYYKRGIRYLILTHARDNHLSDSSFDTTRTWNGLSPLGIQVIAEMNRLGMMVDVSHLSDSAFYQVMRCSKAPAIASHSSCRFYTPGYERNMSDEMIKELANHGGVIQINFGSEFLRGDILQKEIARKKDVRELLKAKNIKREDSLGRAFVNQYYKDHPLPFADVKDAAVHIDHVAKLTGVDHVGIGSDFEGLGDDLPTGLKDVSQYPNLIYELLKMGYSDEDIEKICGKNLLRVWTQVEETAKKIQAGN